VKINLTMSRKTESALASMKNLAGTAPGVGIVRISGVISMEPAGFGAPPMHEAVIARLDAVLNDDRVKAVVLRVDSPGGTVAATQEIFQKLMELRMKKPVVASMGDLAASGGYYVASAANHIVANTGTITGSIGVIIAAPNLKGLFEKLGIRMNVIKSGRYKDILSSSRDLSDEEKALLQELIDSSYEQFLKDVSLGRNKPIDDFRQYADGRVMGGAKAVTAGLVDATGTFQDAVAKARELAKLPDDAPVYDQSTNPIELFLGAAGSIFGKFPALPVEGTRGLVEYRYRP